MRSRLPEKVRKPNEVVNARTTGSEFTLLDRKIFNILLGHAYNDMQTKQIHRVTMRDLSNYLMIGGHESPDRINQSLDRLFHGEIEVRFKDVEGDEGILRCHYLSFQRSIKTDGYLEYAFDPILIQFLRTPKLYSLIQLPVVVKFKSAYSLRLYEIMQGKYGLFKPIWRIGVDEAMDVFEIKRDSANRRFDMFRPRVVEKAIGEVNAYAEFDVKVEYFKSGRGGRVTEMTFTAMPKPSRIAEAVDKAGALKRSMRRDQETVDMFRGRSDGTPPTLRQETMSEARRMVDGQGDVVVLFEAWLDAFRSRGYGSDPDETFLAWLRIHMDQKRSQDMEGVDVDSIFQNLLMGD